MIKLIKRIIEKIRDFITMVRVGWEIIKEFDDDHIEML